MLVWAVWCYPDTCLELLKVIWSWAVFPDAVDKYSGIGYEAFAAKFLERLIEGAPPR